MTSGTYNRTDDCYDARWDPSNAPTNSDMDGIAVAVASVVIHICLRILITWSPGSFDEGIQAILLQIYPTLVSTLLSVGRKQLSLFDAQFALTVTSSPLAVYISYSSVCNLLGIKNGLYEGVKSHRLATGVFGASVILLWIALDVILTLSDDAFIDSEACAGQTFWDLLHNFGKFLFDYYFGGGPFPLLFYLIFASSSALTAIKTYREVVKEASSYTRKRSLVWMIMKSLWRNINHGNWFKVIVFLYLDISWAYTVVSSALDASEGYVLSYGQVLAVLSAVPCFISTVTFVYSRRWNLLHYVRDWASRLMLNAWRHFLAKGNHHSSSTHPTPAPLELRELLIHGDSRVGPPGSSVDPEPQQNSPTPAIAGDPARSRSTANTEPVELTQRVRRRSGVNTSERSLSRNTTPQRSWTYG